MQTVSQIHQSLFVKKLVQEELKFVDHPAAVTKNVFPMMFVMLRITVFRENQRKVMNSN